MKKYSIKGRHGTHSPFAYDFVTQVLRAPSKYSSLIGRYLFPVSYIKNQDQIFDNFVAFYNADILLHIHQYFEIEKYLFLNSPSIKRIFIIIYDMEKVTLEFQDFLMSLQDENIEYAVWATTASFQLLPPFFNRKIELLQAMIYFHHSAFKEVECFQLR